MVDVIPCKRAVLVSVVKYVHADPTQGTYTLVTNSETLSGDMKSKYGFTTSILSRRSAVGL